MEHTAILNLTISEFQPFFGLRNP